MPPWTITQYPHQNIELETSPSVKKCVSKILKESPERRQEHQGSRQLEAVGVSSSGRPVATEDVSSEKKVHLHPNIDGEKISKFGDPAKNVRPQSEEYEFNRKLLNSICAKFSEDRAYLHNSPFIVATWSQLRGDCLWASSWRTEDHEDFTMMAMNKRFPRKQDLLQFVQRQVKTLIGGKDAYNMQTLQDWNTFRWSRNTLMSDPAAKIDQDESSRALRLYIVCVGVSNRDPSNSWTTTLEGAWNMDSSQHWIWHSFGKCYQALLPFKSWNIFRNTWTDKLQNLFMRGSYFMSVFQRHWMDKEK